MLIEFGSKAIEEKAFINEVHPQKNYYYKEYNKREKKDR